MVNHDEKERSAMHAFDIIGPVMVGPSSSHTAGVVRIGNVARNILGRTPAYVRIKFHGSFAKTYTGHGSDKAVIGGLLGYRPDDERIRDSLEDARSQDVDFSFETVELRDAHPNSLVVEAADYSPSSGPSASDGKKITLRAESLGGGRIMVRRLDDFEVAFDGQYDTLIIRHSDKPGVISLVANVLSVKQINIANMKVYRTQKGGDAIMVIEADEKLDKALAGSIGQLPHILGATVLEGLS